MKNRVLPLIASTLVVGAVMAQDLFSWYSVGDFHQDEIVFSGSDFSLNVNFEKSKKPFVDNYTDVFAERMKDSHVGVYRSILRNNEVNYGRRMYRALLSTCIDRYELAQLFQEQIDWVRDKTTLEKRITSEKKSRKETLRLILRPSVRSANVSKIGGEIGVRGVGKVSYGSLRIYSDHAELVLPLRPLLVREGFFGLDSKNVPQVSIRSRCSYDGRASVFIGYEKRF